MLSRIVKRRVGLLGSISYSASNFFLAYALQSNVPGSDFGLYAFALILLQFGVSISNALFASPIVVWLDEPTVDKAALLSSFFTANLLFIGAGSLTVMLVLLTMGMSITLVALVVLQATLLWIRWFIRAIELARHNFVQSTLADITYGIFTFVSGAALFILIGVEVRWALVAMLVGTILSLVVVGRDIIGLILERYEFRLSPFLKSFRDHGAWALVGVITTEMTANLHSYVLIAWLGPAAFAPVAILSLFFRPIPILMQSLTQYERPVLARLIREGNLHQMSIEVRKITSIMTVAVALNTFVVSVIIAFAIFLVGNGQYPASELWPILGLLALGQLVRGLRTGPSAAAQSKGMYRPLAFATIYSSLVVLSGTAVTLLIGWQIVPMVLSVVLVGEVLTAILILITYEKITVHEPFA